MASQGGWAVTGIVLPITRPVSRVCDQLDDLVGRFIKVCGALGSEFGKYESEVEARSLFMLAIRNIEGVVELARRDLAMLSPALAAARAAFETAIKGC